jgi:diguanylate cyclase (GGDEF)-like protein
MLQDDLKKRLERCTTLPSPPGVAMRLLDLFQDVTVSVSEVSAIMKNDPALSAKVLRIVNSPLYALRREVSTLEHAISLLGVNAVQAVALSFSLARTFTQSGFDFRWYWKRSVIAAASAQELGRILRLSGQETLFMGGLLQDLGILVLSEVFKQEYGDLLARCAGDHAGLVEQEKQLWEADHAAVGGWLVGKWGLPEVLEKMVRGSHEPDQVEGSGSWDRLVRCVALSGWLAEIWLAEKEEVKQASEAAAHQAKELLEIDEGVWEPALAGVRQSLGELSELFEFELQSQGEIDQLLEQAKETMFLISLQSAVEVQQRSEEVDSLRTEVGELKVRSETDPLTKLHNRAYFQSAIVRDFNQCQSRGQPLTLVVCDIDHFKKFNDTYGHASGDVVLEEVAKCLSENLRGTDQAARYGGEEFVLILRDTDESAAEVICERLRRHLEARKIELESGVFVTVTMSLGCATQSLKGTYANSQELFKAADQALYAAKHRGRNQVASYRRLSQEEVAQTRS